MTGEGSVWAAGGPMEAYKALEADGEIHPDADQLKLVERFDALYTQLLSYDEITQSSLPSNGLSLSSLMPWKKKRQSPLRGIYIHGGVGRGKSMLMDLFYETAPIKRKSRVHFHEFMQDIHGRMKAWRQLTPQERVAAGGKASDDDPIPPVARQIALESTLLCFDELQVNDITDAMVLGRLFRQMLDLGVVMVTTSNRLPDELYKDGLNRQLFLPCIEMLKDNLVCVQLDGPTDYRLDRLIGLQTFYTPVNEETTLSLRKAFFRLTDRNFDDADKVPSDELSVMGRTLFVPKAARGVAVFSFKRLCANPLGAADYLMIARHFHTVIMVAIPQLGKDKRNEAKRFVTFIDALYEQGVKFLCSAEVSPGDLYPGGDGSFEFERTVSRLMEMQSEDYLARGHGEIEGGSSGN